MAEKTWSVLAHFLATMQLLGPKLRPITFQMSPGFVYPRDVDTLQAALEHLPSLGAEGLQLAMEFRHPS
jgi:uncharacterized protein YecE (DUF72 family)